MVRPTILFGALVFVSAALFACSSSSDTASTKTFKCQVSAANSGDLCQVNFNCESGDSPAAYCSKDGSCDCGPKSSNPKSFTHAGICDLEMNERASVVNDACGFGM
jgi:hypothetical protein